MIQRSVATMLLFVASAAFAAEDPDIRELMTAEEFSAAGLGRLSEEEIAIINAWLIRYTAEDAEEILENSPAVRELAEADIRTRIDGEFHGWNGPTQFRLQNGEVWETNSTRTYDYFAVNPEVELSRNWLGIYRMRVVETGQSINVRKVD